MDQLSIAFGIVILGILGIFAGSSYLSDKKKKNEILNIELKECVDESEVSKMSPSDLAADIKKRLDSSKH